jgi:formylglycine-generating enzyme
MNYKLLIAGIGGFFFIGTAMAADQVIAQAKIAGETFLDCPDCPEMVVIPAGNFEMGSPSTEVGRFEIESLVHHVTISHSFAMGKSAITRGQFAAFVNATNYNAGDKCLIFSGSSKWLEKDGRNWKNPGYPQDDSHPAVCINWNDAAAYIEWLSRKTGEQYKLPSEAEWEYSARAGTSSSRFWGENADEACGYANVADQTAQAQLPRTETWTIHNCTDGYAHTAPVKSFKPNAFGLYDMIGNVWEWVGDGWHDSYNKAPSDGVVWQGDMQSVLRGGSWNAMPQIARMAARNRNEPSDRFDDFGFRVERILP